MNESKFALKFGMGAGFLGVLCCVGPIIPILLGIGSGAALFGLDQYKPWFIGLGFLLLAGASWYGVRKRNACCTTKNRFKDAQLIGTIFAIGILTYIVMFYAVVPALSIAAEHKVEAQQTVAKGHDPAFKASMVGLNIKGMTCAGCSVGVKQALLQMPGVIAAEVDWQTGKTSVQYDRNQTTVDDILHAKIQEQYTLSVAQDVQSKASRSHE